MYHLCSPHSFCVDLFVWCTVVYAHGRTYIDVSFSCLYGVPLVYARGRTRIDRALAWLRSNHWCFPHSLCVVLDVSLFVFVWCTVSVRTRSYLHWRGFMWLYGVPLVYARGRTYIDGWLCLYGVPFTFCHGVPFTFCHGRIDGSSSCLYAVPLVYARIVLTLPGFIVIVWCTVCLVGVPFMFCLVLTLIGLIMSVRCTVSVRTRSYLHWWTFLVCVWYTVYVLCLYHVCMVYRWCFLFFSSFLYLSAVTFSCNY